MNQPNLDVFHSIRTKFGIFSALFLLSLLSLFYMGGRYILVHMIRDAEQEVKLMTEDLKRQTFADLHVTQRIATSLTKKVTEANPVVLEDVFTNPEIVDRVTLFITAPQGKIKQAYITDPKSGRYYKKLLDSDLAPYMEAFEQVNSRSDAAIFSGIVSFGGRPYFATIAKTPKNNGYLVIGSTFKTATAIARGTVTQKTPVSVSLAPVNKKPATTKHGINQNLFSEVKQYQAGSTWHIGANMFEAVIPITDINGDEIFQISVSLPRTFSSLTTVAMGWLTMCIAAIGAVMIIPVLWIQAKILLNPLTRLARKIHDIALNIDVDTNTFVEWRNKDELGIVAQSVNTLIETINRKSAQLKQNDESQRIIIQSLPDSICVVNRAAILISIKHAATCSTVPFSPHDIGHPLSPEAYSFSDRSTFAANIASVLDADHPQVITQTITRTDGEMIKFECRMTKMSPKFVLISIRDVTKEFKELQSKIEKIERIQRKQRKATISAFAAAIAHDLNTMLTVIKNATEINQANVTPDFDTHETILEAIDKGTAMAQDLMAFAGDVSYAFQTVDPNAIITKNYAILSTVVAQGIMLDLNLAKELPQILADPQQLWKVFLNLIKNASEASAGKSATITISSQPLTLTKLPPNTPPLETTPAFGPGVQFTIHDTGVGMTSEQLSRIFEPFYSTKSAKRGLGLASVIHILEAHKGLIQVTSNYGQGTTFTIWLPAVAKPILRTDAEPTDSAPTALLFVEDETAILKSTTTLLNMTNPTLTIYPAQNREGIIDQLRAHSQEISTVLLDARIPGTTPREVIRLLKAAVPQAKIIVASGLTLDQAAALFSPHTFDDFIPKPYSITELNAKLR